MGNPISEKRMVDVIISNFEKTAEYPDYVKDWNKKTVADQAYANLKTHFMEAEQEHIRQLTMKDLGYAGAATNTQPKVEVTIESIPPEYLRAMEAYMLKEFGVSYCSSHGMVHAGHHSKSCTNKCNIHKDEAMLCNKLGGSTKSFVRRTAGGRNSGREGRGGRG